MEYNRVMLYVVLSPQWPNKIWWDLLPDLIGTETASLIGYLRNKHYIWHILRLYTHTHTHPILINHSVLQIVLNISDLILTIWSYLILLSSSLMFFSYNIQFRSSFNQKCKNVSLHEEKNFGYPPSRGGFSFCRGLVIENNSHWNCPGIPWTPQHYANMGWISNANKSLFI